MARTTGINFIAMVLLALLLLAHLLPAAQAQSSAPNGKLSTGTTARASGSVRTSGNRGQAQKVKRKPAVKNQKGGCQLQ